MYGNNHEYSLLFVLPLSVPQAQKPRGSERISRSPTLRFYSQFCSFFLYDTWNALFALIASSLLYQSLAQWTRVCCPSSRCCRRKAFSFGWSLKCRGRQREEVVRSDGERAHQAGHSERQVSLQRTIRQKRGMSPYPASSGKAPPHFFLLLSLNRLWQTALFLGLKWTFLCHVVQ